MKTKLSEINQTLVDILKKYEPPLRVTLDTPARFDVCGTKIGMQGKQRVAGLYFGSVILRRDDVRLYFSPINTHYREFWNISGSLRECLIGIRCFYFTKMDRVLESNIDEMVKIGVEIYKREGYA